MPASKQTDVTPVTPTEVDLHGAGVTTKTFVDIVRNGGKIRLKEEANPELQFDMLADMATADSVEDLFGSGKDVLKVTDVVGKAFKVISVEFRNSDDKYVVDGSIGIYAVLHIEINGRKDTLVTGASDVIFRAMRAMELSAFPRWLTVESNQTKGGFTVYNLVDAASQSDAQADF